MQEVALQSPHSELKLSTQLIGRRVLVYDSLPSAMTAAAALAHDPIHNGTAILAGMQTAGRGQYGRSWLAAAGSSVLLAVVFFPPRQVRKSALLTAWATVSVADTVLNLTQLRPRIKWPNDVLLQAKKIAGILIESRSGENASAVVGIGLNVAQSPEQLAVAGLPEATSLSACTGRQFEVLDVARALLEELDQQYASALSGNFALLELAWAERVGLIGLEVIATTTDGEEHRGRLLTQSSDRLELIRSNGSIERIAPESVRGLRAV